MSTVIITLDDKNGRSLFGKRFFLSSYMIMPICMTDKKALRDDSRGRV